MVKKKKGGHWFYLEPYVHLAIKGDGVLFYNTLSGAALKYEAEPAVTRLARRLWSKRNGYVVRLSPTQTAHPKVAEVVAWARDTFSGDVLPVEPSGTKPFQFAPRLSVRRDVKGLIKHRAPRVTHKLTDYLEELTLFINSQCSWTCATCKTGYRQFAACSRHASAAGSGAGKRKSKGDSDAGELSPERIGAFLREIAPGAPGRITVSGGNILKYSSFPQLLKVLDNHPAAKTFIIHYRNLWAARMDNGSERANLEALAGLKNSRLEIVIDASIESSEPSQPEELVGALNSAVVTGLPFTAAFVIQSEADFQRAEALVAALDIAALDIASVADVVFNPCFNGHNLAFLREAVFYTLADVLEAKPDQREILSRRVINPFFFGHLYVFGDGRVAGSVNGRSLGQMGAVPASQLIYKELTRGMWWRRVRRRAAACNGCVYCDLCPALSNYETLLKRNNLCKTA